MGWGSMGPSVSTPGSPYWENELGAGRTGDEPAWSSEGESLGVNPAPAAKAA